MSLMTRTPQAHHARIVVTGLDMRLDTSRELEKFRQDRLSMTKAALTQQQRARQRRILRVLRTLTSK